MSERIKGWLAGLVYRLIILLTCGQISPLLGTGIAVEQDGKLLVIQRADGQGYTMPGGIVSYKETVEHCILRETLEETGYTVQITGLLGVYSSPTRDPRFCSASVVYKGILVEGSLRASKEGQPAWCHPDEIVGKMAFDGDIILQDYLKGQQAFT